MVQLIKCDNLSAKHLIVEWMVLFVAQWNKKVKETFGSKLKVIVPGIRNQTDNNNDQKRTLSAKKQLNLVRISLLWEDQ